MSIRRNKIGSAPGTLPEEIPSVAVKISVMDYSESELNEFCPDSIEEILSLRDTSTVSWINVDGKDIHTIKKIGEHFNHHPLVLEDVATDDQRPKMDEYDDHLFIVLNMLSYNEERREVEAEQISLILGNNYVISFQEAGGDVFDPNRIRIRKNKGKIRKAGADYLLYSLIDTIVDHYYVILEKIGERIEELEDYILEDPTPKKLNELYSLKRQIIFLKRSVWPLRELIIKLQREESPLIKNTTQIYIKDVYDHTIQIIETIESYRDILAGMIDVYMSSISNRMNQVMKVLTVISTIFIPLTFITGIYGMNFEHMPELKWNHGYYMVLLICSSVAGSMLLFFKRKGWL